MLTLFTFCSLVCQLQPQCGIGPTIRCAYFERLHSSARNARLGMETKGGGAIVGIFFGAPVYFLHYVPSVQSMDLWAITCSSWLTFIVSSGLAVGERTTVRLG